MSTPIDEYKLLTPLTLGDDLVLKNRVVFGPLTRARADRVTREASELNQLYYEQRAGAGLIITEATSVSEQAHGWYGTPACYTEAHAVAWKRVVDRVHARGGKIFLQMWHMGRQGHSSFNAKKDLVSASAIGLPKEGQIKEIRVRDVNGEYQSPEVPRPLETEEVAGVVEDFRKASVLAKKAGFDGVEIHGANGYLIDQFLQSCSNKRTDKYGGSYENRARFLLEVVDAVKTVWPSHRIGVRLAPNGTFAQMGSEDNYEMFTYTMAQLSKHNLAYLAVLDGPAFGQHKKCRLVTILDAKTNFKGRVMGCNSYTKDIAEGAIRSGCADLIAFGRLFVSNPDLAERFQNDWPVEPLAPPSVYWNGDLGAEGYVTFPSYKPSESAP
ncbi:hypothetical protein Poli38472_010160 [Pythium oligandrum]|uniref:NADH:flavin oxidoreductase/NADH oxidase N-terminal domain-containing protein n=1 Tax=Pythium oligandrum TaxID=41045 RepID=A0A8K1C8Z0_PYTOL|nr:hypothetical protein Poli38472_010160 [Pythium oligandrum]|eukprot:TMW58601.1 hypothetical protein Poli38472_010160 [Pythium oligandrum]